MFVFELAGEDDAFAAYEAAAVADGVRRVAPGVALAERISPRSDQLAFTHRIGELVTRASASVSDATAALAEMAFVGSGSAAVRASAIRGASVDTQEAERTLGTVLVERGFEIDLEAPDAELRVVFSGDEAFLSWLRIEPGDGFSARRPTDRRFFQPGSLSPRLARALVNIAGGAPGVNIFDPMCGTGGVLIEAGRIGAQPLGMDVQRHMVVGARRNCRDLDDGSRVAVMVGDARALPLIDHGVDAVVCDAPYGRQSRIDAPDRESLLTAAVTEARRVSDRAVVVADRPINEIAVDAGWLVRASFARRVHRSLTRHVHDLRGTT